MTTTAQPETLTTLRRFIEHAPPAQKSAVAGWQVGPEQLPLCGGCAGRILDRGCGLPLPADPVWQAGGNAACCLCDKVF
jgi:hypothetical protein